MLYEHSEKRLVDKLKIEAAIHGIKLDEPEKKQDEPVTVNVQKSHSSHGVAGDPDSYAHLTKEERQELTDKMMGKHKIWVHTDKPLGGKDAIDKR